MDPTPTQPPLFAKLLTARTLEAPADDFPMLGPEPPIDHIPHDRMELEDLDDEHVDLQDPAQNTYELVKQRHEKRCFKIEDPFIFVVIIPGKKDIAQHNHVAIKQLYHNKYYFEKNKQGETEKQLFITRWLGDEYIKTYKGFVIDPNCTRTDVYNLWRPYIATEYPPVDPASVDDLIEPIVNHIRKVITSDNEEHTQWILDYLANIIQRPSNPTRVAILLYGLEGACKGMIFDFFRKLVLGDHCSAQSSNVEQDMFARFANLNVNCVFTQLDEIQELFKFWDRLKDLITNRTLNYERKNKDPIVVSNMVNLLFTSNNENVLKISPNDRRFVLFRCTNHYLNDKPYQIWLGRHLDRQDVARAFYQHLSSRSLEAYPYDFQASRPITDYYKEAQLACICPVARFMSALVNDDQCGDIKGKELYDRYKNFVLFCGYKNFKTVTGFGIDVKRISGVSSKRNMNGVLYTLKKDHIKAHLQKSNQYDPDASWL
jgi:hypothetical protein